MSQTQAASLDSIWRSRLKQGLAVMRVELRRNLLGRRAFFVMLLAFAPVFILFLRLLFPEDQKFVEEIGGLSVLFAIIFRTFYLRLAIFFGCVGIFTRLFRGDLMERTLHYYFLAPVRREVVVLGKYLAGIVTVSGIFSVSISLAYLFLLLPRGWGVVETYLFDGPGLFHWSAYLGVTFLASLGYGSVFLLTGLFFRNPIIPAAVILGWEYINFLLPPFLKKISVIYYLESLCPVPIPEGPITILAEPAPFWLAVPGLFALTILVLVIAGFWVNRMEVSYSEE